MSALGDINAIYAKLEIVLDEMTDDDNETLDDMNRVEFDHLWEAIRRLAEDIDDFRRPRPV